MHWKDWIYFAPLVEQLEEIDRQLDDVYAELRTSDLDPLCLMDDAESLSEEGFLRCQLYMIERKGDSKPPVAYACGPKHGTRFFAETINAAGNYRKHRAEWPRDLTMLRRDQRRTLAVLRDAGVTEDEFRLSYLLSELCKPGVPRFSALIPRLIEWREAFDRIHEREDRTRADVLPPAD